MASSYEDLKTRIATLRREILSYKPGKAVPCDDERVVFPDTLTVVDGMDDMCGYIDIVNPLKRDAHSAVVAVKLRKLAIKRQTYTWDQEDLTDSVSLIITSRPGITAKSKSNKESSSPTPKSGGGDPPTPQNSNAESQQDRDKTTSFPSSPNTSISTATSTTQKAFRVITLLTLAAAFGIVSGTTPELFTTTGETVNIPCLFGEGTIRNIHWSYSDGTRRHKILSLADGGLTIEAEYANRASLQNDTATLILKDITVADEGTYRCDVDRQGQTVVPNIRTKLNVFSLRPDTLPVISPCIGAKESSSCSIHANQSFTLTCTLPNVYPVEDTELIWYQDGKHFSSIHDVTQNDDGTSDISRQIRVSETGNFTCNATYPSTNGRDNTAVSVEAWVIPPADVPNTLNWTRIALITISTMMIVCILAIITLLLRYCKARGQRSPRKEKKPDETQFYQEELKLAGISAENCFKDGKAEYSEPTERPTASSSKDEEEELELLRTSAETGFKDGNGITAQSEFNEESPSLSQRSASVESSKSSERPTKNPSKNEEDSTTVERILASTDGYPPSHIRAKDLDFYVSPSNNWWIVAKINNYFVGKRVYCTPYVHPPVKKGITHIVSLYIHDDQRDVNKTAHEEMKEYIKLCPSQPMFVERRMGDIFIELFDGPKEREEKIDEKRLVKRDIYRLSRKIFFFAVKPLESGACQQFLKFTLDQKESLSDPTEIQFVLSYDGMTATTAQETTIVEAMDASKSANYPVNARLPAALQSGYDLISDGTLDRLSKQMPAEKYTSLCRRLGIEYIEANNVLRGVTSDYQRATRYCLAQWKTRSGGNMAQLKTILQEIEVGDLAYYIE